MDLINKTGENNMENENWPNVTIARNNANDIFSAKKFLSKWAAKRDASFVEKWESEIANREAVKKEGLYIVCGDTFSKKTKLKELGFSYCSCCWYSKKEIPLDIEGLVLIKG